MRGCLIRNYQKREYIYISYLVHIPGTYLCCCHVYIQRLLSGPETKCKICCVGLYYLLPVEKVPSIIETANNNSTEYSSKQTIYITRLLFCSINALRQMVLSDTPVVKRHKNQSWLLKKAVGLIQKQTKLVSLPHAATKNT